MGPERLVLGLEPELSRNGKSSRAGSASTFIHLQNPDSERAKKPFSGVRGKAFGRLQCTLHTDTLDSRCLIQKKAEDLLVLHFSISISISTKFSHLKTFFFKQAATSIGSLCKGACR